MTINNARLMNAPRLRELAEIADGIADQCNVLGDALANYENAAELPAAEQAEARNEAREEAWSVMGEILEPMEHLKAIRDRMLAGGFWDGASLPVPDPDLVSYGEGVLPPKIEQGDPNA